jgi:Major tropism determinant N-terminal domain
MASQIKLRRGTRQQWISAAPIILAIGEPGLELDSHKVKYGDGTTEWQSLPYASEPIPDQTGNAGKYLTTDGNGTLSWASDNDSSYVTSSSLTTTLSSYITSTSLTTTLSSYVTSTSLTTALSSYATTSALNSLLPSQTGHTNYYLKTDGAGHLSWAAGGNVDLGTFVFNGSTLQSDSVTIRSNETDLIIESNAAVAIKTNGFATIWTFGSDGTLNLPLATNGKGVIQTLGDYYFDANGAIYNLGADGTFGLPNGQLDFNAPYSRFKDATNTGVQMGSPNDQNYVNVDNDAITIQVNSDGVEGPANTPQYNWIFDTSGTLVLPQNAAILDTGNSVVIKPNHTAPEFQLEIKAYTEAPTPDDIHIRANNSNYGLAIGDSNGGSYVNVNGDINHNTIVISTINKNDEERKNFTFDVLGNLHVPGDVLVSSVGEFKNSAGIRAAYLNEVPRDISDLTDNMSLLPIDQQPAEINIDGGHALAFFAIPLSADGGGSAGRFGPNSIVFDGGGASGTYTNTLNGGGA